MSLEYEPSSEPLHMSAVRFPSKREHVKRLEGLELESQSQSLALTVLYVPASFNSAPHSCANPLPNSPATPRIITGSDDRIVCVCVCVWKREREREQRRHVDTARDSNALRTRLRSFSLLRYNSVSPRPAKLVLVPFLHWSPISLKVIGY